MGRKKGGRYQKIRWVDHRTAQKYCCGPLHQTNGKGTGTWVDVSEFGVLKSGRLKGRLRSCCKACDTYQRVGRNARMVPVSSVAFAVEELVRRLGVTETHRRLFKTQGWLYAFRHGKINSVLRETAVDIVMLLAEVRRQGEVRSKRSIRRGSHMRGEQDTPPRDRHDFYKSMGDAELEARRRYDRARR